MEDLALHSIEQNIKTYRKRGTNNIRNKHKMEKEDKFDQLLNTKCSWSYKKMNTANNESLSSQNTDTTSPCTPNVKKNKSNDIGCPNKNKQNSGTNNLYGEVEEHISPSSFDGLLTKKNLSPKNQPQNNRKKERKNLRSLKPVNYANESSSDEELVFQSRIYNRSKFDDSDEEQTENGMIKDGVSKNASEDLKFEDSLPCTESFRLKDTNISKSSDNVLNQDSNMNTSRNDNTDEESVSSSILFEKEIKSNEPLSLKNIDIPNSPGNPSNKYSNMNASITDNTDEQTVSPNILLINETHSKESVVLNNTDILNSSDNFSDKASNLNFSGNDNVDDDSVSLNMVFSNDIKSKDNAKLKTRNFYSDEKVKSVNMDRSKTPIEEITTPFQDFKKQPKSNADNVKDISISNKEDSDIHNERSIWGKSPTTGDTEIEKDHDSDFNNSFFRMSFPYLSNDEAISEMVGDDLSVFEDSDVSSGGSPIKVTMEPLLNVSKNKMEQISNKNKKYQELEKDIHKDNRVKENIPSKNPSKRNSNHKDDTFSIQSDHGDASEMVSTKYQKKVNKGKKLYVKGLPNDIKDLYDDISLEVQSIGNKSDMSGSMAADDEFTRDFMDGTLDYSRLDEYLKNTEVQNNQPDKNLSRKLNSSSTIQKEKELVRSHEDASIEKQQTHNPFDSTNIENKSVKTKTIHSNDLIEDDTIVDTSYFQELTGKIGKKQVKSKPKRCIQRGRKKIQTSKSSTKNHTSQELDDLNFSGFNDAFENELEGRGLITRNTSIQSNIEKKRESKSEQRKNKNTTEESILISTPCLSPKFLTMPVKRKKVAELVTSTTESKLAESMFKAQKKDEAEILDSAKKTPMRSWEDLEAELLSDANENKNINEIESFTFLSDEDTNAISYYENTTISKVAKKQRDANTSKRLSVQGYNSKNFLLNRTSSERDSPQIKYVFNKSPPKVDKKATHHECKNKSTSLVPYTSNSSIIEKTIANMNRSTSSFLTQFIDKRQPSKGGNSDRNNMDGIPVEFSYSIQQIKSTMYIKPSKGTQNETLQNEILNTWQKSKSEKQNTLKDIISPMTLGRQFLPALTSTSYKSLEDKMIPSNKTKPAMTTTKQKQNMVINSRVTSKNEKLLNSRKAKKSEKSKQDTSTSSSEDEITYKTYFNNEKQLDSMKKNILGKRKLNINLEKGNLSSKKTKKELSMKKTCRDEMNGNAGELSEEEITPYSGKQQLDMRQGYSKETNQAIMNKEETSKKRSFNGFSSDSSEGYQSINESLLQANGQFSSLGNAKETKNSRYPSTTNTKEASASKSTTMSNLRPSLTKDVTAQNKLQKRKDVEDYQRYLKNTFQFEDSLSQGTFKYGDKPKTGKQLEDDSDDVFSISSIDSERDKEVPKGTGLLCDLFDA